MKVNKEKLAEYLAEFLGTLSLVLVILLSGVIIGGNELIYQGVKTFKFEPFLIGFTLAILIYGFGRYSKAHFNPIVTVAMAINRRIRILDAITYILIQFLAALAAYPIANWIRYQFIDFQLEKVGAGATDTQLGALRDQLAGELVLTNTFQDGFTGLVFVIEALFAFVFVMTILFVATNEKVKNFAGFVIGTTLAIVTMLGASISGASYHPFRSLAPAIIEREGALDNVWVYLVAPLVGAIVAAVLFLVFQIIEGNSPFPIPAFKKVSIKSVPVKEEKVEKKEEKKEEKKTKKKTKK